MSKMSPKFNTDPRMQQWEFGMPWRGANMWHVSSPFWTQRQIYWQVPSWQLSAAADSRKCIFKVRRRKFYLQSCRLTAVQGHGEWMSSLQRSQREEAEMLAHHRASRTKWDIKPRGWLSSQECEDWLQISSTHRKTSMIAVHFCEGRAETSRSQELAGQSVWLKSGASVIRKLCLNGIRQRVTLRSLKIFLWSLYVCSWTQTKTANTQIIW